MVKPSPKIVKLSATRDTMPLLASTAEKLSQAAGRHISMGEAIHFALECASLKRMSVLAKAPYEERRGRKPKSDQA